MTEKNLRKRTEPKTATPRVTAKTAMWGPELRSAPVLPGVMVLPASSRPMRATTGPMAAGGRMTSIQSVPNFQTTRASRQPSRPTTTKPPWAYSKP